MVTVWAPATLTSTRWPAVGAAPVLQFAPIAQSPLVPIQQSSTEQVLFSAKVAVVAPYVGIKPANAGALIVANEPLLLA